MADAEAIASIYNEGLLDHIINAEIRPRETEEIIQWLESSKRPFIVAEQGENRVFPS